MTYAISDIHGCYDQYRKLLEKIDFKDTDTLYMVGDACDRGPEAMKVLLDLANRKNVIPVVGNHEKRARESLRGIADSEGDERKLEKYLPVIIDWLSDGGVETLESYLQLKPDEQEKVLEYLESFGKYARAEVNGQKFLMVHGGLEPFDPAKSLDSYKTTDVVWARHYCNKKYFDDTITISGHTPTPIVDEGNEGEVICRNNHVDIDCGCVFGYRLAAYCLDNGEVTYVEGNKG